MITKTNQTFSIYTPEKEIKIYCGKRLEEYQKKLDLLAKRIDNKGYSDTVKECVLGILDNINKYQYEIAKTDIEKGIKYLISEQVFPECKSISSIVRKCIDKNYNTLIKPYVKKSFAKDMETKSILNELYLRYNIADNYENMKFINDWVKKYLKNQGYGDLFRKYQENSIIDIDTEIKIVLFLEQISLFSCV